METTRIKLRKRSTKQLQAVLDSNQQAQFDYFGLDDEQALEKELNRIRKGLYDHPYSGIYFDLLLKSNDAVIGSAGFHMWWRDHDRAEIGYWLNDEKNRRQGYMNEVLPFLLNYGFSEMNLHRIEAKTAQDNVASIALLEKYGFKKEAVIHGHYKMSDGTYSDDFMFYLLKDG